MAAFTSVAAGVGLAVTAATTAASFAQAAEQNEKKKKAEESAAAAMMEARKKLDVNYYEQLSIQKEPYELARREMLTQGALATQQLAEGDPRALAAGVGRVQLAQQLGQEKVATAMQQEKSALDKLVAGEESRLRDLGAQLDLQEVVGAQQAMSDAITAESMAIQQGLAGVTSLAGQVASLAPLYEKTPSARQFNQLERRMQRTTGKSSQEYMSGVDPSSLQLTQDQSKILNQAGSIGGMSKAQYTDFMGGFSPDYIGSLEATMSYDARSAGMEKRQNKLRYYPSERQTSKYYDKFNKTTPLQYTEGFDPFNPFINY
jgi:hypothetical protein